MSHFIETTKEKVLHSVITLFIQGKNQLSMAEIARETGISKSTLYHFFANKKDLFTQVVLFIFEELKKEIHAISLLDLPPEKKLFQMMETMVICSQKESGLTHFIFQQVFENDPEMLSKIHDMREEVKSFFESVLSDGMEQGVFTKRELDKSSEIIVGYMDFIALRSAFRVPQKQIPIEILFEEIIKLFLSPQKQ